MAWVLTESGKQPQGTSLSAFINKMRKRFLPNNWELQIQGEWEAEVMRTKDSFMDWATRVKKKNSILKNTTFFYEDAQLLIFLQPHLAPDLLKHVYSSTDNKGTKIHSLSDFAQWEQEVQRLNNMRIEQIRVIQEVFDNSERCRPAKSSKPTASKDKPSDASRSDRCPLLTEDERSILHEFEGVSNAAKFSRPIFRRTALGTGLRRRDIVPFNVPLSMILMLGTTGKIRILVTSIPALINPPLLVIL
jgi:hypothetical protein